MTEQGEEEDEKEEGEGADEGDNDDEDPRSSSDHLRQRHRRAVVLTIIAAPYTRAALRRLVPHRLLSREGSGKAGEHRAAAHLSEERRQSLRVRGLGEPRMREPIVANVHRHPERDVVALRQVRGRVKKFVTTNEGMTLMSSFIQSMRPSP